MLPLEKIKWKEETLDGGIVELRGGLSLHLAHRIAPEYRSEIAHVKREMRLRMWREVYGELTQPIMELQLYARRGAAYGADGEILKLCETINRLLEPPPEAQMKFSNWSGSSAPLSDNVRVSHSETATGTLENTTKKEKEHGSKKDE